GVGRKRRFTFAPPPISLLERYTLTPRAIGAHIGAGCTSGPYVTLVQKSFDPARGWLCDDAQIREVEISTTLPSLHRDTYALLLQVATPDTAEDTNLPEQAASEPRATSSPHPPQPQPKHAPRTRPVARKALEKEVETQHFEIISSASSSASS